MATLSPGLFGLGNALSGLGGSYGSNSYANQQSISYEEMVRQQRQMLMAQSMQAQMAQWPPTYPQTSTTSSGSLPDNAQKPRRTENHMTVRESLQHHVDKWLRDVKLPLRISV